MGHIRLRIWLTQKIQAPDIQKITMEFRTKTKGIPKRRLQIAKENTIVIVLHQPP